MHLRNRPGALAVEQRTNEEDRMPAWVWVLIIVAVVVAAAAVVWRAVTTRRKPLPQVAAIGPNRRFHARPPCSRRYR